MGEAENKSQQLDALSPAVIAFLQNAGTASPDVLPVSAAMAAKARRKEEARLQALKEAWENPKPGQEMQDKSIFLGQWRPVDRDGNSLGKVFNVFAAPKDLERLYKYDEAAKRISQLEHWHGHGGTNYADDTELYQALRDGSYTGGWIIPTRELLNGKDVDGEVTTPDNLNAHKNRGTLKDMFTAANFVGSSSGGCYWSSTRDREDPSFVHSVSLLDGCGSWSRENNVHLRVRPMRLELVAQGGPA